MQRWSEPVCFVISTPANEIGHSKHHETLLSKSRDYIGKHFHRFPHLLSSICVTQPEAHKEWEWKNRWDSVGKKGHLKDSKGSSWACMCSRPQKGEKMRDVMGRPSHPLGDKKKKVGMDRRSISTCTKEPRRWKRLLFLSAHCEGSKW